MALVFTVNTAEEELIKIGNDIELRIKPKNGNKLVSVVLAAPKNIRIERVYVGAIRRDNRDLEERLDDWRRRKGEKYADDAYSEGTTLLDVGFEKGMEAAAEVERLVGKMELCDELAQEHYDDAGATSQEGGNPQGSLDMAHYWSEKSKKLKTRIDLILGVGGV